MGQLAVVLKSEEKPWVDRTMVRLNTERLVHQLREQLSRVVIGECHTMSDVGKEAAKKLDATAVEFLSTVEEILDVIEKLAAVNGGLRSEVVILKEKLTAALHRKDQQGQD